MAKNDSHGTIALSVSEAFLACRETKDRKPVDLIAAVENVHVNAVQSVATLHIHDFSGKAKVLVLGKHKVARTIQEIRHGDIVRWNGVSLKKDTATTIDSQPTFYHPYDSGEFLEWCRIARWENELLVTQDLPASMQTSSESWCRLLDWCRQHSSTVGAVATPPCQFRTLCELQDGGLLGVISHVIVFVSDVQEEKSTDSSKRKRHSYRFPQGPTGLFVTLNDHTPNHNPATLFLDTTKPFHKPLRALFTSALATQQPVVLFRIETKPASFAFRTAQDGIVFVPTLESTGRLATATEKSRLEQAHFTGAPSTQTSGAWTQDYSFPSFPEQQAIVSKLCSIEDVQFTSEGSDARVSLRNLLEQNGDIVDALHCHSVYTIKLKAVSDSRIVYAQAKQEILTKICGGISACRENEQESAILVRLIRDLFLGCVELLWSMQWDDESSPETKKMIVTDVVLPRL